MVSRTVCHHGDSDGKSGDGMNHVDSRTVCHRRDHDVKTGHGTSNVVSWMSDRC